MKYSFIILKIYFNNILKHKRINFAAYKNLSQEDLDLIVKPLILIKLLEKFQF
jgi:hypothetical protein